VTGDPGAWWADPALARVWGLLRARLEERGLRAEGRAVITGLTRKERHAVSTLVGRPVLSSRLPVDLAGLDTRLSERSGIGGLVAVVEAVTGAPLADRPALRAARGAAREAPVALARTLLAGRPWLEQWLAGVRGCGLLARAADPERAVRRAAAVLDCLPAADPVSRTELAAALAGGAHGLDDGTTAAALVLRALAADAGEPVPTTAATRRALWDRYGVRVDLVSSTCLSLGLRGDARLDLAADVGDPVHLTAWDLRRRRLDVPRRVLVCENPRVLEAVAERFGGAIPAVCTSGQPTLAVLDVLGALAGSELRYHGDFDWPGVAIANRLVREVAAVPWRMDAADYLAAVGGDRPPLAGAPVEPLWDGELGAAMGYHGVAVHEEAVLPDLLAAMSAE
jgi:uncharacterized protein (TIGR02679 family)